jgi:hypothetical protein
MAIVMQYDKGSGVTYAYKTQFSWGVKKKIAGAKRRLLGIVDSQTGEIIPVDGKRKNEEMPKAPQRKNEEMSKASQKKYNTPEKNESPKSSDLKSLCDRFLERCESQKKLAEKLKDQLDAMGKPLDDLKTQMQSLHVNAKER